MQDGPAYNHLGYMQDCPANSKNTKMHYMQDRPAYNHLHYTQDSNLTNPKPNSNPLTLTVTLVSSLICTNQTHHPRKSPLCFQKYITISVCQLLIWIVLRIAKTDRSCRTVLHITSAKNNCIFLAYAWKTMQFGST